MRTFQYQILRYSHDAVTGEFVNVGIIIYQPDIKYLKSKVISRFSRISGFFEEINGVQLLKTIKNFSIEINQISYQLNELFTNYRDLTEITNSVLPKDDSALICSEIQYTLDLNPEAALSYLYNRLINKYTQDSYADIHDDKYAWKKVYKKYFDKNGITNKLQTHVIKTKKDEFEFDKSWKNGALNCYQSISFQLKRDESIKNKVYKWVGILSELQTVDEELHLYFLTLSPGKRRSINKFIHEMLLSKSGRKLKITLIDENKAEAFANEVKIELEKNLNN